MHPCSILEASPPNLHSSLLYSLTFWRPEVQGQGVPGPSSLLRLQRGSFLPLPASGDDQSWGSWTHKSLPLRLPSCFLPYSSVPSLCLKKGRLSLGLGPTRITQDDLTSGPLITPAKTLLPNSAMLTGQGRGCGHHVFGALSQPTTPSGTWTSDEAGGGGAQGEASQLPRLRAPL